MVGGSTTAAGEPSAAHGAMISKSQGHRIECMGPGASKSAEAEEQGHEMTDIFS